MNHADRLVRWSRMHSRPVYGAYHAETAQHLARLARSTETEKCQVNIRHTFTGDGWTVVLGQKRKLN